MGKKPCNFRNSGCTRQAEDAWNDYCSIHRCRVCKKGVRDVSDKYCGMHLCDGYTETYRRCPSKKLGLLDGQPSSEALGRYCQEHSCNKCGAREDMDYCRKCTCVTLSCYDVRSDKYKNSAYCTPHTCTKCHVRPKDRNKSRCVVC